MEEKKTFSADFFLLGGDWTLPDTLLIFLLRMDTARGSEQVLPPRDYSASRAHTLRIIIKNQVAKLDENRSNRKVSFALAIYNLLRAALPPRCSRCSAAGFKYETKIRKTRKCDDEIGSWNHSNGRSNFSHSDGKKYESNTKFPSAKQNKKSPSLWFQAYIFEHVRSLRVLNVDERWQWLWWFMLRERDLCERER